MKLEVNKITITFEDKDIELLFTVLEAIRDEQMLDFELLKKKYPNYDNLRKAVKMFFQKNAILKEN